MKNNESQEGEMKNKQSQKNEMKNSFWIEIPLRKFGSKCIMNKHELCMDPRCRCLCHNRHLVQKE